MAGTLQVRPFGPFVRGVIDTANASNPAALAGTLKRATGIVYSGARKLSTRAGSSVAMTFKDDQGSPATVTAVCAIAPFADWALVVAHSTVTSKAYLYRVAPDFTGWYNAAGALQSNTNAQPVGVLWSSIADPPDVTIAEGLGIGYIAHNAAADGATLAFPLKSYTVPATIASVTADLDVSGAAETLYALGVVSFQQHLWIWGVGSGTTAANHFRPELLRYCQPIFTFPFLPGDSITVGNRVRSQREKIVGAVVAGEALYVGSPFGVTRITGYGRTSWFKEPLDSSFGFPGPKCMTARGDTLYYWSSRGPMRCAPGGKPEPLWTAIEAAAAAVINPETVVAGYDEASDLVMFAYNAGNGVRTLAGYDAAREVWVGPDDDLGLAVRAMASIAPVYGSAVASTSPAAPSSAPSGPPTGASTTGVGATSATFNWTNGDSSAQTSVEYRRQGDTTWIVSALADPGVATYVISGLTSGVAYEWRVAHYKGGTYSSYLGPSGATQFTPTSTLNPPSAPSLSTNQHPGYTDILITWINSGESDVLTDVELAGPSAGAPAGGSYVLQQSLPEPIASTSLSIFAAGTGKYWVRLRHTKSGFTSSSYSGPTSIDVTVTGDQE